MLRIFTVQHFTDITTPGTAFIPTTVLMNMNQTYCLELQWIDIEKEPSVRGTLNVS